MLRNISSLISKKLPTTVCRQYSEEAPFNKILVANRGEIAIRVFRGANELGVKTVGIYSEEDKLMLHRTKCDESYVVGKGGPPLDAYLNIDDIVRIALEHDVEAVHPGYGFLSERADFSQAVIDAGMVFIGPDPETVHKMGNKTEARELALSVGVPVIPGTDGPVASYEEAEKFCEEIGYPVMLKASYGGGGRGMRVVHKKEELKQNLETAQNEALSAFGNGDVFIEKFMVNPRHVEVQILGDKDGNVVHLYERDCSVQRRNQKVVEVAPAPFLAQEIKDNIIRDAVILAKACGYKNAGTVEFLIDADGKHHFIEVNARLQVEHTVTEEITGIDLVHAQLQIAAGKTLEEIGLFQEDIKVNGCAIQCRVTTEDPEKQFTPDIGHVSVFRMGEGMGIRVDAAGYAGVRISPHYDSLLAKITGKGRTHEETCNKLIRALDETRIRGVKSNIPFLKNVLKHDDFLNGRYNIGFIDRCPELFEFKDHSYKDRATKLMKYFGTVSINGPQTILGTEVPPSGMVAKVPTDPVNTNAKTPGLRNVFLKDGAEGFAKAVREREGLMICDTTPRDAHQSLLATRVRTHDLKRIAPFMNDACSQCYSMEMWGGATFDVAMRFLRECPWERVEELRELIPDVPFQMLLRGANAVGYAAYPDNVVYKFCQEAVDAGIDVFRIFDSLNYLPNLELGMDAVGSAGGIVEAAISYSGDCGDPNEVKYTLDYYLKLADELVKKGAHILCIKDMAGLLKPNSAYLLVKALRDQHPDVPIHIHTHDTAGAGVASMLECARAGADVVDAAVDSLSGMTSQPSMGAIVAALEHNKELSTRMNMDDVNKMSTFWEEARTNYAPFEATSVMKSGSSDVYKHQIPGGQYTNLIFQASCLNMFDQWPDIKKAYTEANGMLGNIIKVTPSSKVVGDMAQFMVQNGVNAENIMEKSGELSYPESVIDFMQGKMGIPYQGYPEELREAVLKGKHTFVGRPGAELEDFDFEACRKDLEETFPNHEFKERDLVSAALYPQVFREFMTHLDEYGETTVLSTDLYFVGAELNQEFVVEIEPGKELIFKMKCVGPMQDNGEREVFFEVNGQPRSVFILDTTAAKSMNINEKADKSNKGSVGAPMPGEVVGVPVSEGDEVKKGDHIITLSAMKMETTVTAPIDGTITRVVGKVGQSYEGGDLLIQIE